MLVPPDPRTLEQVIGVIGRLRPSTTDPRHLLLVRRRGHRRRLSAQSSATMRAVVSNDTSNAAQAPVRYHPSEHLVRSLGYIVDGVLKIDLEVKHKSKK